MELHGRAGSSRVHGFAVVSDAQWVEHGVGDGHVDDGGTNVGAANVLAPACPADAYMGDVGSMFRRACGFAVVLRFEPRSSPTAWSRCGRRTPRTFTFHLRLRRRLRRPTGFPNALLYSAEPNERDWRV